MPDTHMPEPVDVVVTGGGTVAPIDEVRKIVNSSTGRFAALISESFLERGALVRHLHTPGALVPFLRRLSAIDPADTAPEIARARAEYAIDQYVKHRDRLRVLPLDRGTVADYAGALERTIRRRPPDLVVLAMAVSDYEPRPTPGKIPSDADELVLRCRRTPKVIRQVRDWAPDAFLVGFKLLTGATPAELDASAVAACTTNRVDLTVANDLHTYRAGSHAVRLVRPGRPPEPLAGPIAEVADRLVDRLLTLASERP